MSHARRLLTILDPAHRSVAPAPAGGEQIEALARTLGSRRTALGGLLGGLAGVLGLSGEETSAHDPRRACKRLADRSRRRRCLRRAKRHIRQQHSCTCPAGTMCIQETCVACDVCASGCAFTTVQTAVDAASPGATIRICPGREDGQIFIEPGKDLTLEGAGADRTTLECTEGFRVLEIEAADVVLRDLTVSRGTEPVSGGGGIYLDSGSLVLDGVIVTGNSSGANGGGILNAGGTLRLTRSSVTGNSAGGSGGGIYTTSTGQVTIETDSSVTNNSPDNCAGPGTISGTCDS